MSLASMRAYAQSDQVLSLIDYIIIGYLRIFRIIANALIKLHSFDCI